MNTPKIVIIALALLGYLKTMAQEKDSVKTLKEIIVTGYKAVNGVGHLLESEDGVIYAGKKTEVIVVDSLDANKAINNTRQILGRIPGLNIVETESSGFTANGIATRGLNPTQSIEMNTRQNGYNISADVYGYNEAYYIPPMEAVKRIELVRGAASLQFGSQFGGLVNYITEDAPKHKAFQFITSKPVEVLECSIHLTRLGEIIKNGVTMVFFKTEIWRARDQTAGSGSFQALGKYNFLLLKK